jgi:sarcosine oxidase gamma subunit
MVDEKTIDLVCFRSVADFVARWLANAAAPGSLPDHR